MSFRWGKSTQVHLQPLQLPGILSRDHCRVQYRVFFASFGGHGLVLAHERSDRDSRLFLRVWKPAVHSDIFPPVASFSPQEVRMLATSFVFLHE